MIVVSSELEVVRKIELLDWRRVDVAPGGHRAPEDVDASAVFTNEARKPDGHF